MTGTAFCTISCGACDQAGRRRWSARTGLGLGLGDGAGGAPHPTRVRVVGRGGGGGRKPPRQMGHAGRCAGPLVPLWGGAAALAAGSLLAGGGAYVMICRAGVHHSSGHCRAGQSTLVAKGKCLPALSTTWISLAIVSSGVPRCISVARVCSVFRRSTASHSQRALFSSEACLRIVLHPVMPPTLTPSVLPAWGHGTRRTWWWFACLGWSRGTGQGQSQDDLFSKKPGWSNFLPPLRDQDRDQCVGKAYHYWWRV